MREGKSWRTQELGWAGWEERIRGADKCRQRQAPSKTLEPKEPEKRGVRELVQEERAPGRRAEVSRQGSLAGSRVKACPDV